MLCFTKTIFGTVQSHHPGKIYDFDITRADIIFDWLVKEKKVKLTHELPPNEELENKIYCKWHGKWTHNTNNCTTFREVVQKWIKYGILKFPADKLV